MKKSIAVLSLTIAGALGLAACGGNSGTNSSPSASASASASATASAPASTSTAATSASTTSAAAETTKAETKTTQGTISAPSALPSEALKKSEESNQQATSALYSASKESLNEFKEDPSVKKVQTSDGTVYYTDEVAAFESKDGAIVIIKNTGAWSNFDSNGGTIVVDEDGSWIKTNPEDSLYTAVRADGAAAVLNTKTLEQATDLSTIDIPKAPGPVDGFRGTAKTPAKPTKVADFSEITGLK